MTIALDEQLAAFSEQDYAVRAVRGLLGVLPFVPNWQHPGTLEEAAARHDALLARLVAERAARLAEQPGPQMALKTFDLLDKGDKGIALFSGLQGAVKTARGVDGALETDPQQAADAGLKALGISYAAWKLFPSSTKERLDALLATESGRALLLFYVAADVILPFGDNAVEGGAALLARVVDAHATPHVDRLSVVAGAEAQEAVDMLAALAETLQRYAQQSAAFVQPMTAWAKEKLPGLLGKVDVLGGVVATGVDALAAYRYLGAALVAEVCLAQALAEVRADIASGALAPPLPTPVPTSEPASLAESASVSAGSSSGGAGAGGVGVVLMLALVLVLGLGAAAAGIVLWGVEREVAGPGLISAPAPSGAAPAHPDRARPERPRPHEGRPDDGRPGRDRGDRRPDGR